MLAVLSLKIMTLKNVVKWKHSPLNTSFSPLWDNTHASWNSVVFCYIILGQFRKWLKIYFLHRFFTVRHSGLRTGVQQEMNTRQGLSDSTTHSYERKQYYQTSHLRLFVVFFGNVKYWGWPGGVRCPPTGTSVALSCHQNLMVLFYPFSEITFLEPKSLGL